MSKIDNQNFINHIAIVIDESGSMGHLRNEVPKIIDCQVEYLAQRSVELQMESRATVYTFNSNSINCIYYDTDMLRIPSMKEKYSPGYQTPLIDATLLAVSELEQTATLHGSHAFLIYIITDGEENASHAYSGQLSNKLNNLPPNWTVAVLVPNQSGVSEAKRFGFPKDNIAIWDSTTAKGLVDAGELIRHTTDQFMQARKHGITGSKSIFTLDVSKLNQTTIEQNLTRLNPHQYEILDVHEPDWQISAFVQRHLSRSYHKGDAFYEITKSEIIQPQKEVAVFDTVNGGVYTGNAARSLLGLPSFKARVRPADHPQYDIFIQSTSVNRKLVPGTKVLVLN